MRKATNTYILKLHEITVSTYDMSGKTSKKYYYRCSCGYWSFWEPFKSDVIHMMNRHIEIHNGKRGYGYNKPEYNEQTLEEYTIHV